MHAILGGKFGGVILGMLISSATVYVCVCVWEKHVTKTNGQKRTFQGRKGGAGAQKRGALTSQREGEENEKGDVRKKGGERER